jgi:hypothetical protein
MNMPRLFAATHFGRKLLLATAVTACLACSPARAGIVYTFVGSWQVDQSPFNWALFPNIPAYTGQEAAALLFGGNASSYAISTTGNDPAQINFDAWYTAWGGNATYYNFPGIAPIQEVDGAGLLLPDYYKTDQYYILGNAATPDGVSALGADWAQGPTFTNYAFLISEVPEPAPITLLGAGLLGLLFLMRRREPAR